MDVKPKSVQYGPGPLHNEHMLETVGLTPDMRAKFLLLDARLVYATSEDENSKVIPRDKPWFVWLGPLPVGDAIGNGSYMRVGENYGHISFATIEEAFQALVTYRGKKC